jgi:hypothetical protein
MKTRKLPPNSFGLNWLTQPTWNHFAFEVIAKSALSAGCRRYEVCGFLFPKTVVSRLAKELSKSSKFATEFKME